MNVLQLCRIPRTAGTFTQDGARWHTANMITQWFEWVSIDFINDWLGDSPNLNPFENLWSIIKAVLKERNTSSVPKLEAAARDIWNDIGKSENHTIQTLALSVPGRLTEPIAHKGSPTKY